MRCLIHLCSTDVFKIICVYFLIPLLSFVYMMSCRIIFITTKYYYYQCYCRNKNIINVHSAFKITVVPIYVKNYTTKLFNCKKTEKLSFFIVIYLFLFLNRVYFVIRLFRLVTVFKLLFYCHLQNHF